MFLLLLYFLIGVLCCVLCFNVYVLSLTMFDVVMCDVALMNLQADRSGLTCIEGKSFTHGHQRQMYCLGELASCLAKSDKSGFHYGAEAFGFAERKSVVRVSLFVYLFFICLRLFLYLFVFQCVYRMISTLVLHLCFSLFSLHLSVVLFELIIFHCLKL